MGWLQTLQVIKLSCMYMVLIVAFLIGKVLKKISCLRTTIIKVFDTIATEHLPPEVYWNTLFGVEMFQHVWHSFELDTTKRVSPGKKAINSPVISVANGKCFRLLDFARVQKPLVVNFGSCSCPVFMRRLPKFNELFAEFKDVADFVIVYVEEAHPKDGWSFEDLNNTVSSHKTIGQRCSMARSLSHNTPCPVLADTMLDAANMAYGVFPIRLYVIEDNHVLYQGGTGPTGYSIKEVSDWLKENTRKI